MDSLEKCRIMLGLSADNTAKLEILDVLLGKAREDIEAFCRDTFIDDEGEDVFPKALISIQELNMLKIWWLRKCIEKTTK